MEKLLQQLSKTKLPFIATEQRYLQILSPSEFKQLLDREIIADNGYLKSTFCELCQSVHSINYNYKHDPQIYCSEENAVINIKRSELIKYRLFHDKLISYLFRSSTNKQPLVREKQENTLWFVGKNTFNKQSFHTYFYLNKSTQINIDSLLPYNIIIYLGDNYIEDGCRIFLSLSDVISRSFSIDMATIKNYISQNLHFVELSNDGRVLVYKKVIASIPLQSAQYFFFKYLYQNYGEWKDNKEIYSYVSSEMASVNNQPSWHTDYGDGFSKAMLDKIKKSSSNQKLIGTIVQNNRKKAYRLNNPS